GSGAGGGRYRTGRTRLMVVGVTQTVHNLLLWLGELGGFALLVYWFAGKRWGMLKGKSIWGMMRNALDARASRIDAQLRMAEESRAEARRAHEEAQAEIAKAHEEAEQIVSRAEGMTTSLRQEL